jgi:hypothetical protein
MNYPARVASSVVAVRRGETIDVDSINDRTEPFMVLSRCAHHSVGYYCEPCRRHLANVGNLTMHLERPGSHRIAVWCSTCRYYQACDQAQLDALTPQPEVFDAP